MTLESVATKGLVNIAPIWRNNGATPTKEAISHVNWVTTKLPKGFQFGDVPSSAADTKTFIAPQGEISIGPFAIPIAQLTAATPENPITFWGWIVYRGCIRS